MEIDGPTGDRRAEVAAGADVSGRAQAVLDRLVRDSGSPAPRRGWLRAVPFLVVAAAVLAVVAFRRPAPIDERLPIATSASASESSGTSAGSSAAGSSAAGSSAAGSSTAAELPAVDSDGMVVVHVVGAVASPGVVELGAGSRVVDAVTAAGGLRTDADPDRVNLAAPLEDGQRVVVPVVGQEPPVEIVSSGTTPGGAAGDTAGSPRASPIDLNKATAQELDSLPGVGPATAASIISHREKEGPFRSVDDLLDVRGIGEAKLESMRDLVVVGS